MKIYFGIPSYGGVKSLPFLDSLDATLKLCKERGHEYVMGILSGCCYVQVARNEIIKSFRDTDADILFFLDDDMSWTAEDALQLIEMPDEIVAAAYRYKTENEDYPIVIKTDQNDRAIVREDGCIAAAFVPTGFLRIKRSAIEKLCASYPEQAYFKTKEGIRHKGYFDLFPQGLFEGQWTGEDYAFCRLWSRIGGEIWVMPDIDISHHGTKEFKGNYHKFLLRQPGGSEASVDGIARALNVPGWMSAQELLWLAEHAKKAQAIAEIGAWVGRSTRALADNTPGTVCAIDTWDGSDEHKDILANAGPDDLFTTFQKNVADLTNITAIRKPSIEAAKSLSNERFDFVFIDGAHDRDSVRADIGAWLPLVHSGGVISGHDYDWSEVRDVVAELLPNAVHVPQTTIWYAEVQ
jgi:predicted O-methyltransferase YrrM